jgi:hypothetical protein
MISMPHSYASVARGILPVPFLSMTVFSSCVAHYPVNKPLVENDLVANNDAILDA